MFYSRYLPQNAIKIYPDTAARALENQADKPVTMQDRLEKEIAIKTLPSKYHPVEFPLQEGEKYITRGDKGPYLRDETWMQFIRWRMVGEEDQTIERVKAAESVGIMMPAGDVYNADSGKLTKMPHARVELNIRDVGKYISLEHNFRQHLMDYMRSDEGKQLADFLNRLGYEAEDIKYIAIGFVPEGAIYGVGKLHNGQIVIYAHKDSYKKIDREAEAFGMKEDEMREVAIGEEITHIFRKSKPSIAEEEATKETLLRFYETLTESTSNPKLKAKYARIIKHLQHDIATVGRYAKINASLEDMVDLYCADVGELVSVLEAKALYEGINTEKGINAYVVGKLEEIAKASDDKYLEEVLEGDAKTSEYSDGNADGEGCEATEGEGGDGDGGDAGGGE